MQAPAAKPAIAPEAAPAAPPTQVAPAAPVPPAGAPRNGNGGSVAPTTVQPVQPSGHQPTQASSAATAAHQRPANGTPAPAQAGAKQSANGKEDDEDWWTE